MQSTYLNTLNTTANAIVFLKWIGYSLIGYFHEPFLGVWK